MYRSKNRNKKIKSRGNLFVWILVLVMLAAIAVGNIEQGPLLARDDGGIEASYTGLSGGGSSLAEAEEIVIDRTIQSIAFDKNSTVKDALRALGAMYKKNIVPSLRVEDGLGFTRLHDVTFEEAMDAILGTNFKYDEVGNLIKVYTREEYRKIKEDESRMVSRVFTLYYLTAAEATKFIEPMISNAGSITGSSAAGVGISTGEEGISGEVGGDSMALHDAVVIYDFPENIAKAEKVIKLLDVRPKQVLVEATILSATLTEGMQLGVDLNLLGGVSLDGTSSTDQIGTTDSLLTTTTTPIAQIAAGVIGSALETVGFTAAAGGSGLRIGVRSGPVTAFITALESVTDITILANPKILALNKQVGTVFIGTKLGYRSQTTQTDTSTTQKVAFLDTGTKLSFRPYIGGDGYIRMDIYPKDSSGQLDADGIPTETTAELTTNIMVKDGETIVIGGLFRDDVRTVRSQIPLLGDLPFVGALFRGTNDTSVRQEIIILLTPHIIERADQTQAEARIADISRKRYGARMGLQWTGRGRLAEDRYTNAVKHHLDGDDEAAMQEVNLALNLRPTYLEALRLKERIIGRMAPDEVKAMERIMLDVIEQEEARKWLRR